MVVMRIYLFIFITTLPFYVLILKKRSTDHFKYKSAGQALIASTQKIRCSG